MEDTPCLLKHVVIVAYETMYQKNPDAAKRIHQEVSNFLHLLHYYYSLTLGLLLLWCLIDLFTVPTFVSNEKQEVLAKQKALILVGETLLLSTIRFDFNIQHPYEPLKFALKKLGIVHKELRQSAMSLINDT